MANTYLLLIDQIYIQPLQTPEVEVELINVVTAIDYRYEGTSEFGTVVNFKSTKNMPSPSSDSFTKYEDVTYEMAQDWIRHTEPEESDVYKILDDQIKDIESPRFVKPDVMPWEVLPPGEDEINAQNEE